MEDSLKPEANSLAEALGDLALSVVTAVPVPGVSSVIDYFDRRQQAAERRSIEKLLGLIRLRLSQLEGKIAKELASTEELDERILGVLAVARRSQREEKLRAAANLIVNQCLPRTDPERLPDAEADLFMRAIEQLPLDAVLVLGEAYKLAKYESRAHPLEQSVRIQFTLLRERLKHMDSHLLVGLVAELDRFGLLQRDSRPVVRSGNWEDQPFDFTPLGARFIERLVQVT